MILAFMLFFVFSYSFSCLPFFLHFKTAIPDSRMEKKLPIYSKYLSGSDGIFWFKKYIYIYLLFKKRVFLGSRFRVRFNLFHFFCRFKMSFCILG